jgi:hypothetical protein
MINSSETWPSRLEFDGYTDRVFFAENPHDPDNTITIAVTKTGRLAVSVSDEQAAGSYNQHFECTVNLPRSVAEKLAKAIAVYLEKKSPPPA